MRDHERQLAKLVRDACLKAARKAYEEAGLCGLCAEGRWEVALGAIAAIDLDEVLRASRAVDPPQ